MEKVNNKTFFYFHQLSAKTKRNFLSSQKLGTFGKWQGKLTSVKQKVISVMASSVSHYNFLKKLPIKSHSWMTSHTFDCHKWECLFCSKNYARCWIRKRAYNQPTQNKYWQCNKNIFNFTAKIIRTFGLFDGILVGQSFFSDFQQFRQFLSDSDIRGIVFTTK